MFVRGEELDKGWGDINADGIRIGDDGGLAFSVKSADLLKDIASSRIFALYLYDNIVASLSLTKSAPAVEALRACAKKVNASNPSDPLAGAELPSSDRE